MTSTPMHPEAAAVALMHAIDEHQSQGWPTTRDQMPFGDRLSDAFAAISEAIGEDDPRWVAMDAASPAWNGENDCADFCAEVLIPLLMEAAAEVDEAEAEAERADQITREVDRALGFGPSGWRR